MIKVLRQKEATGFTLVELLVAISIMVLIAAIAIPNLRQFNDTQQLQNASADLIRVLRLAQSSANSRTSCTPSVTSRDWEVLISSSGFQLFSNCYNVSTASPYPTALIYTAPASLVSGVTFAVSVPSTSCSLPTTIRFLSEAQPYSDNRFSNINYANDPVSNPQGCASLPTDTRLTVTLSHAGQTSQYVCVDKGGAIYATTTGC